MSEEKRPQPMHIGVGTTSIIAVFVLLCLSALAVLCLTSARGSLKTTQTAVSYVSEYRRVSADAQNYLAETAEKVKSGLLDPGIYSEAYDFSDDMLLIISFNVKEDGSVTMLEHRVADARGDGFSEIIEDGFGF